MSLLSESSEQFYPSHEILLNTRYCHVLVSLGNAVSGDYLCIYAEAVTPSGAAVFSLADPALRSTWQRIRLK